jgi:drug/metabolite transporter (DMT)-like permease
LNRGTGTALALFAAVISGVSVHVAKMGTQVVPDPFVYTTARNLTVGAVLVLALVVGRRQVDVSVLSGASWLRLGSIALVGGSVPFLLFFWGLTLTTAATGSLIQKTQFLWVALFAAPLLGEKLNRLALVALAAILVGTAVQGPVVLASPGVGAGLVLLATLLWAGEAMLVRRVVRDVPPMLAATARMAGGALVLLVALALTGRLPALLQLDRDQVFWVVVPSILLLGYVLSWYSALRHLPATVVTSLLALGAPVTALLGTGGPSPAFQSSWPLLPGPFGSVPLLSVVLLVVGCAVLLASSPVERRPSIT